MLTAVKETIKKQLAFFLLTIGIIVTCLKKGITIDTTNELDK